MTLEHTIEQSKKILMQYWPLGAFIATNPLWSLRDCDFAEIVCSGQFSCVMHRDYFHQQFQDQLISLEDIVCAFEHIEGRKIDLSYAQQWVDASFSKIHHNSDTTAFLFSQQLNEFAFQDPLYWIKENLYVLLRDYFGECHWHNQSLLHYWLAAVKPRDSEFLADIDKEPVNVINRFLSYLGIPEPQQQHYLQEIFLQLYGWASFMNWRNHHSDNPWCPGNEACEILLVMWLYYECMMMKTSQHHYQHTVYSEQSQQDLRELYIWQTAFELHYLKEFERKLLSSSSKIGRHQPQAQFIFCIDTRSEGFRRHIEQQGDYETFGTAGFFGVLFKCNTEGYISYQAPALVAPEQIVSTTLSLNIFKRFRRSFFGVVEFAKKQIFAPFALFETLGFWYLWRMLIKTLYPQLILKKKPVKFSIDYAMSLEDKITTAHALLTSIGLVDLFADRVFLCAHESQSENNPFRASLNCGACGGNSGLPNAYVMTDILNDKEVRHGLSQRNIIIPERTRFIMACHQTTCDRLEYYNDEIPEEVIQAIDVAAKNLRDEKRQQLPGVNPLARREISWSELIPELGLINNTAFIIGPRHVTATHNFERRVFLQSYNYELDPDAEILASILSAPAVVAHWISAQYYFSTTNPLVFGAGNKALHNVLPRFGVLEGNLSDLKVGLPLQSVYFLSQALHEPRRLIVAIYAPHDHLQKALAKAEVFKRLYERHWIYVLPVEPLVS